MSFFNFLDKAKKNQSGFTLIELIVTLAIFSIVLVVAGNYLFFGNNLFVKTEVKNSEKYIGDNVFEYIQRRLTYATHVEVINPDKSKDPKYTNGIKLNNDGQLLMGQFEIEDKDGKIKSGLTNVFSPDFYGTYRVSYEVKVVDATHMEFKVNVLAQGNDSPVYTTSEVLKILNLQANARDSGSILITNGERNAVYADPVISYEEDKKVSTTYDPLVLKDQMMEIFRNVVNGNAPKDYTELTNSNTVTATNDVISSYVTQHYYKDGPPYLHSWDKGRVYPYWPNFPGFDEETIKNVDEKVMEITGYKGTADDGKRENQTLTNYLKKYGSSMKMRAYLYPDTAHKLASCFVYVSNESGQQWTTRLVYCDEPGETGWYYLATIKEKGQVGYYTDKFVVEWRTWKKSDIVSDPYNKEPVYNIITNKAGAKQEGIWVKVE